MAPAGPPRPSQSARTTIQPTPTMEPNASVKYSLARMTRRSGSGAPGARGSVATDLKGHKVCRTLVIEESVRAAVVIFHAAAQTSASTPLLIYGRVLLVLSLFRS